MALAIANVQNFFDTDNQAIYNTDGTGTLTGGESGSATYQLVGGRHYFVLLASHNATAGALPTSLQFDPDGTPLTFNKVTDGVTEASSLTVDTDTLKGVALYHAFVSSTTATAFFRATWSGTQSAGIFLVFYITGQDETGTFVQVVKANGTSASPAATMASFASADNGLLLCICRAGGSASDVITATEGRTELSETLDTERLHLALHYQLPNGGDTTVGCTLTTSAAWQLFGIEIKASAAVVADFGIADVSPRSTPLQGGIF